jgi:polyhydroxybutyrate depolymerase
MQNTVRTFHVHTLWPEALVVYPQGLKTPGKLTDPEGKRSGWQHEPGEQQDRDLKFFDAMLEGLSTDYAVDSQRVYSTGHSNGGGFTYLLWAARGDRLAAVAPSAATASWKKRRLFQPKPVMHLAGKQDELVKFEWQERTMAALRVLNQCVEGKPWEGESGCTLYESGVDTPVVTCIHEGGHKFPASAPALIVKFFRELGGGQ